MTKFLFVILFLLLAVTSFAASVAPVHVLAIDGQIDPSTADYVEKGIKNAQGEGAQAVLVIVDTPGGLMTSMQKIVKTFLGAGIPIIAYVYPDGSTAASAGTFIVMSADIAAMSPVSNIGSASPIQVSPSGGEAEMSKTMQRKVMNYAVEYARSIAKKRGRNVDWAEKAVKDGANLKSDEALKLDVIDVISPDIPTLMKAVNGRKIKLAASGRVVTLKTAGAVLEKRPMSGWETFLHYLSNPLVAFILMLMAINGIIYELANPGSILPGVVGGIALILLLYSFSVIPVNAAGFAFIALAIIFFVAELFTPGTGLLAAGGTICLFFGYMMLFRSTEGFMVSIWILATSALLTAAFFLFLASVGLKGLRRPYISGREGVIGHTGEARTDLTPSGRVFVEGALWSATSESGAILKGDKVDVIAMDGLKLTVRKHGGPDMRD